MFKSVSVCRLAVIAGAAVFLSTDPVFAQQTAIEEITVTARKKEEGLQSVGMSVQAITADQMQKAGLDDISRLELIGAGVSYGVYGKDAKVALRGANSNNTYGDNTSVVGMFVDGVYKPRAAQQTRAFFDVERLEVLKGPQGTLYGRNTFGGAINLITRKPDLDEAGGNVALTLARFGTVRTEGAINMPLSDSFALRVAGVQKRSDGWIENISGSGDLGADDDLGIRVSALWQPSDRTEVVARASHITEQGVFAGLFSTAGLCRPVNADGLTDIQGTSLDCQNPRGGAGGPGANPNEYRDLRLDQVNFDFVDEGDLTETNLTLEINHDFDSMALKSVTSYTEFQMAASGDIDYSPNPFGIGSIRDDIESITQEFTLVSTHGGDLQWTAGLYASSDEFRYGYYQFNHTVVDSSVRPTADALDEDGNTVTLTVLNGTPVVDVNPTYSGEYAEELTTDTDILGVFGQIDYSLTDTFRVIAGVRYNSEDKSGRGGASTYDGNPNTFVTYSPPVNSINVPTDARDQYIFNYGGDDLVNPARKFTDTTWLVGVQYDLSGEMMGYANASTGFLSGALSHNGGITEPQESEAFEIGLKSRFLEDRVQVNLALYRNEYTNLITSIQTEVNNTVSTTSVNGGDVEVTGFEIEALAVPVEGLQLAFNAAFMDAEFGQFGTSNPAQLVNGVTQGFVDLRGFTPTFTPDVQFNFSARYDIDLGDKGYLTPSIQTSYSDEYSNNGFNLPSELLFNGFQESYTKTDFRLTWESVEGKYGLEAFVENIEDEIVSTRSTWGGDDRFQTTPGYPRNYGVKFRYNF